MRLHLLMLLLLLFGLVAGLPQPQDGEELEEEDEEEEDEGEDEGEDEEDEYGKENTGEDLVGAGTRRLPPTLAQWDYQLGGSYPPPAGTRVLIRDRSDAPDRSVDYNACYINGFQTQPDERSFWEDGSRQDLLLRDASGNPVGDPQWQGEYILDIRTAAKRRRLAAIVGQWIDGCAAKGFDAVDIDNLDTYARFPAYINQSAAKSYMTLLAAIAHARGLAISHKNAPALLAGLLKAGITDFVVNESCNEFDECQLFLKYGKPVLNVEYKEGSFSTGCAKYKTRMAIVRRDQNLQPVGSSGYVYKTCH